MLQTGEDIPGCLLQSCHCAPALSSHGVRHFRRGCSCATETSRLDRTLCDDAGPSGGRSLARGKERHWSSYGLPKPRLGFGSMCGHQQHHLSSQAVSPKSDLDGKGDVHIPEGRSVLFCQLLTPRGWLQRSRQSQYASLQINSVHGCYVNPKDSSEALYGEDQSFLLPLLFFGIGTTFIVLGGSGAKFLIRNGTS